MMSTETCSKHAVYCDRGHAACIKSMQWVHILVYFLAFVYAWVSGPDLPCHHSLSSVETGTNKGG